MDDKYRVLRVAIILGGVVRERSRLVLHMNSYKFMLTDDVWDDGCVAEITGNLRTAASDV